MESRALGLVAITMRRALEFEISRIGARSIHLRDNIFRSKYEYYIISAVDAGFSPFLLPPCPLTASPHPPSTSPSRVFISLLLQSALLPSSSYFFFLFIFHAAKANACIIRRTGLLAVPSESNDLRERSSNRSTGEKGAGAIRCLTLSFLRNCSCVLRNKTILIFVDTSSFCVNISFSWLPEKTYIIYSNKLRTYKIKKHTNSNLGVKFHWQRLIIIAKNLSTSATRRRLSKKIMTRINVMI